jgi:hypothetical protein
MLKLPTVTILFALAAPAAAHDTPERKFSQSVRAAMKAEGPIVTDADKRQMRAKCGLPADAEFRNTHFEDGGLHCPNGQVVRDAETRALSQRISDRARHVAHAALQRADVARARAELARAKAAEAVRRVHARWH